MDKDVKKWVELQINRGKIKSFDKIERAFVKKFGRDRIEQLYDVIDSFDDTDDDIINFDPDDPKWYQYD